MHIKKGWAVCLLALFSIALLTACTQLTPRAEPSPSPGIEEMPRPDEVGVSASPALPQPTQEPSCLLSAWAVYWDTKNVITELEYPGFAEQLEALCYFEVFFDSQGNLVVPEEIPALYEAVKARFPNAKWTSYLTFVNDQRDDTGAFSLKDTDLLWMLLGTDEAMLAHVESVIALTKTMGFGGVEIDYESIRKDLPLWERFFAFCNALYLRTQEEGLALRVLLEPITPFDRLTFPQGPTYVMMCYNLHGMHSGPGPKADAVFIQKLIGEMALLPGRKDFAIATGGFDWCEGKVGQLTERAAVALAEKHHAVPRRDEASQAMVFHYQDDKGCTHEVWYADRETLNYWASLIRTGGGTGISIWRLGGNLTVQ